jgi:glycosyltransferase 2 family protein
MSLVSKKEHPKVSRSQLITAIFGLLISGFFIYLSFRGVDFVLLWAGITKANYVLISAGAVGVLALMWSRSWRLGGILAPIHKVDQKTLFPITCVGYMAIAVFPFRLGELIRPILINGKIPSISLTSGFSAVLVERVLDAIILALILLSSIIVLPLPQWLITSTILVLGISLILLISIILFSFNIEKALRLTNPLFRILPEKLRVKGISIVRDFSNGFVMIAKVRSFIFIVFQTVIVWAIAALTVYVLFQALKMNLPILAIVVVLSLNGLGLILPSAPGFVGTFEFSIILALSLFNVPKENALIFAVIFHVLGVGINIVLGLAFVPLTNYSMKRLISVNR